MEFVEKSVAPMLPVRISSVFCCFCKKGVNNGSEDCCFVDVCCFLNIPSVAPVIRRAALDVV